MDHRRDQMFTHALRTIAFHFTKIGEAMQKYADDSAALLADQPPPSQHSNPEPSAEDPSHDPPVRSNRRKEQDTHATKPKSWLKGAAPSSDMHPFPPDDSAPYFSSSYRDGPTTNHTSYPSGQPDPSGHYKPLPRRRKRRATDMPSSFHNERPDDKSVPSRTHRPNKRVRINWSEAENRIFFDTVNKYSHLDEGGVLKEIVQELGGSRNWIQCKGHFRNLVVVGRIVHRTTNPKGWVVVDDGNGKRTSPRSVALNQDAGSHKEGRRAEEPGKIVKIEKASAANAEKGKDVREGLETGIAEHDDRNSGIQSDKDADPDYVVEEDDETMAPDMELPMTEVRKPTVTGGDTNEQAGGSSVAKDERLSMQKGADVERESDGSVPKDEEPKGKQPISKPPGQVGNPVVGFRPRGGWARRTVPHFVRTVGRGSLKWDAARQLARREQDE